MSLMFKITYFYNTSNLNFSFTTNHPINTTPIIKFLISKGFFSLSQCPEDMSFLTYHFSHQTISKTFTDISNLSFTSFRYKKQLAELVILNYFPDGINTYSNVQMQKAVQLIHDHSSQKIESRKESSKIIRDSDELIHTDRGVYIHVSKLLHFCYQRKKATSILLVAITNLVKEKKIIDGQEAFKMLYHQCARLNLVNQYALYGFVECYKPSSINYSQDKIGNIIYQQTKHNPMI